MQLLALTLVGLAAPCLAFPAIALEAAAVKGASNLPRSGEAPVKRAPGFDAKAQLIDVNGTHAFVAPSSSDFRGPCPGLNALANHNYLPHNGVATIEQFIQTTNSVFGMGLDLSTFLATYGAAIDGNLASWSIGGAPPSGGDGITNSHNKYESDGSPTRGDLYQAGNDYLLQLNQFTQMYDLQKGVADDQVNYNLDVLTPFRNQRNLDQRASNPYFFSGPFSGVLVQPAAYTFIYRFMANHTADAPEGVLNRDVLKAFFSITGDEGSFTYTPGYERIPYNWYRRAIGDEYTIPYYAGDVLAAASEYPIFLQVGGNLGKTNSFAGLDPANFTGGVYNTQNLLQGNNLACFGYQAGQQLVPDILKGLVGTTLSSAETLLNNAFGQATSSLNCPQLEAIDASQLNQFPGYSKLSNGHY